MDENDHTNETTHAPPVRISPADRLVLEVDFPRYAHFLENTDLTEAQKRQMLQALWEIVVGFVDIGFNVDPVQSACGQVQKTKSGTQKLGTGLVKSPLKHVIEDFTKASLSKADDAVEGAAL